MAHLVEERIPHGSLTTKDAAGCPPGTGRRPSAESDDRAARRPRTAFTRALLRAAPAALLLLALAGGPAHPGRAAERDEAIDRGALRHDADGPDQILWTTAENPKLRFLFLRLRLKRNDVQEAGARLYLVNAQGQEGFRDHPLEPWAAADSFEYRALTLPFGDDPMAPPNRTHWRGYRLYADDEGDIDWYGADSMATREEKVARFTTLFRRGAELKGAPPGISDRMMVLPAWAQDAVVYRTWIDWKSDTTDAALSAQLTTLRHRLKTLDSLGINTLLVGADDGRGFPLEHCWPPEPTGDAAADSARHAALPCGRLIALCESAHRRQMKVMLELEMVVQSPNAGGQAVADVDATLGLVRQGIGCGVDGFLMHEDAPPYLVSEDDPVWTAVHETAKALLPESYLVVQGYDQPEAADLSKWLTGDRVDAVADGWYACGVMDFLHTPSFTAEAFRDRLHRRRLATPGPLGRIEWHGPSLGTRSWIMPSAGWPAGLRSLLDMTLGGAPQLRGAGNDEEPLAVLRRDSLEWPMLSRLLALRRDHTALRRGSFNIAHAEGGQFAFYRRSSEEILLVAVNRDAQPATIKIALPPGVGFVSVRNVPDLLTGKQYAVRGGEITLKDLPAQGGVVIQLR